MNEYFKRTPDSFNYDNAQQGEGNLYDLRVATRDEIDRLEDGTLHAFDRIRDANDQINFVYEVLKKRIAALEEAAQAHDEDISNAEGRLNKIEEMGERVDELEHRCKALLQRAEVESDRINKVKLDQYDLMKRLIVLETKMTVLSANIKPADDLHDQIKRINEAMAIQSENIDYNDERILDLIAAGTVDHGKYAHLTELQLSGIIGVLKVYADGDNWSYDRPRWFHDDPMIPWRMAREALRAAGLLEDGDD